MKLERDYAEGTIRVSLGSNNTIDEAKKIGDAIVKILSNLNSRKFISRSEL